MTKPRACTAVDCQVCGKTIGRRADLARHMKTHATNKEELMLACNYLGCTYRTLQRSNLATHQNIHSGERPNKCPEDDCDFSTSDPGSLTRHRKEVHGYEPKASSRSRTSAIARKAVRQRRRISPYTSSSSTPPGSSADSMSPSDTTSPRSQTPNRLDQPSSSLLLTNDHKKNGIKNTTAAYSTELINKLAQVDNSRLALLNSEPQNSLPPTPGLLTAPEAPTVESPQLTVPEQETFYATDVPAEATRDDFEDFLAQFDDWYTKAGSAYTPPSLSMPLVQCTINDDNVLLPTPAPLPTPSVEYTVDDLLVPTPTSLPTPSVQYTIDDLLVPTPAPLPTPSVQYTIDDILVPAPTSLPTPSAEYTVDDLLMPTPSSLPPYEFQYLDNLVMPTPASFPSYGVQDTIDNTAYSYPTNALSFDAQFPQSHSFSAPDVPFYPQAVDQTYFYTHPTATRDFPMQGAYVY